MTADEALASQLGGAMIMVQRQAEMIQQQDAALTRAWRLLAEYSRNPKMGRKAVLARLEADAGFASWFKTQYPAE